jgi:hypothetical protein
MSLKRITYDSPQETIITHFFFGDPSLKQGSEDIASLEKKDNASEIKIICIEVLQKPLIEYMRNLESPSEEASSIEEIGSLRGLELKNRRLGELSPYYILMEEASLLSRNLSEGQQLFAYDLSSFLEKLEAIKDKTALDRFAMQWQVDSSSFSPEMRDILSDLKLKRDPITMITHGKERGVKTFFFQPSYEKKIGSFFKSRESQKESLSLNFLSKNNLKLREDLSVISGMIHIVMREQENFLLFDSYCRSLTLPLIKTTLLLKKRKRILRLITRIAKGKQRQMQRQKLD